MKSSLSILVSGTVLATLVACGGSGGDSSPPQGSKVAITSANQSQVVRASVNAGLSVSLAQGSVGGVSPAGVTDRTHALGGVLQRAMGAARASRKGIASASVHPAATISDTEPCGVSGTVTIVLDDRDNNQALSSGDSVSATFAQCKDSASTTINGAIVIALTSTPTDTQFSASANFQSVVVTDNGVTSTISGTVTVAENDMPTVTETTLSVGSSGLTASTASTGYDDAVSFAAGFVITTDETSAGDVSVSLSGTMTAQSVGGSITISTPQPIVEGSGDAYPRAGQVIITGASGSSVRATVLDDTQVRLELDANGDGSYESTSTVAWTALIA
ncbi:MAG: hypothetical protein ACJ8G1_27285 [Vitreoscilla sp.]|jgi:hypothetical protein